MWVPPPAIGFSPTTGKEEELVVCHNILNKNLKIPEKNIKHTKIIKLNNPKRVN